MKLELKKVKVVDCMSEETTCFCAVLYVDGKPAADCSNTGKGGMTNVSFYDYDTKKQVVEFCKQNPVVNTYRGKEFVFDGVDVRVDELLVQWQMEKILKTKQKKALVLHDTNKGDPSYVVHSYLDLRLEVAAMMKDSMCQKVLKDKIVYYRSKGCTVMNTNIDYKVLGL